MGRKPGPIDVILAPFVFAICLIGSYVPRVRIRINIGWVERRINHRKKFNYRYFESLPDATRMVEANNIIKGLIPDGSPASEFEDYFRNSGAICNKDVSRSGPCIICAYIVPAISLISAQWVAIAYTDELGEYVHNTSLVRHLTGL